MKNKYKVLIIGLGNIGMLYDQNKGNNKYFLSHIKSFISISDFEVVGGVDTNKNRLNLLEKEYKIKPFSEIKVAMQKTKPHIVVISTPTETHKNIINLIKNFDINIILCEKPISYNLIDAEKILRDLRVRGIKFFVNYHRRVEPGVLEIKKRIDEKFLLDPFKGVCIYTGGVYNNASHLINLCEFWLGNYINISKFNSKKPISKYDFSSDFRIKFKKGTISFNYLPFKTFSQISIQMFSQNACVDYLKSGRLIKIKKLKSDDIYDNYKIIDAKSEIITNEMDTIQRLVSEEILKEINGDVSNLCSGEEALQTMQLINKI